MAEAPTLLNGIHAYGNEARSPHRDGVNGREWDGNAIELDARTLARQCLKEIGKEMGVRS
jgi:hypothetical protein